MNFKQTIQKLKQKKKLIVIKEKTNLAKISEIIGKEKSALLFENIFGFKNFKIAANICTSENFYSLYNLNRKTLREKMLHSLEHSVKPKISLQSANFIEIENDLGKLPILQHYKEDGGKYITAGIFFAEHPSYGRNLSFHRALVLEKNKLTIRLCHRHLWKFYKNSNENLNVAICLGLDPAILLAGATCTEIGIDETTIASAFNKKPAELIKIEKNYPAVPKDSEIVLLGKITGELTSEGPFVDMTGTIDFIRQQPVVEIKKIFVKDKKNTIYHTIIPGKDEHRFLMGFPREPVIFKEVSKICKCTDVSLTDGGINWLHCAVSIEKTSDFDVKKVIETVFNAHPSVKHVFVFDSDINILDADEREWAFATRFQADKNLYTYTSSRGSSLDPSASGNEDRRLTCKLGFDCTIPKGKNKRDFLKIV